MSSPFISSVPSSPFVSAAAPGTPPFTSPTTVISPFSSSYTTYPLLSPTSALSTTVNTNTTNPYVVVHENIDNDPRIIKKVVRYFYYKTLDKWMFDDLSFLLKYIKISGDKIQLISKIEDFQDNKAGSSDEKEKKIRFFERKILGKNDLKKILRKFLKKHKNKSTYGTKLTWGELMKTQYSLKKYIGRKLRKHLKEMIHRSRK